MPNAAEVYRRVDESDQLSTGDIAYLSLARTRLVGEGPPGDAFDPVGRVPGYPRPGILALAHGREVAVDVMFALVVTHSCEIDRQKNADVDADHFDCRLTVAPIVPEPAVTLVGLLGDVQTVHWAAIEANDPVASLFLPPIPDVSTVAPGLQPLPWPRFVRRPPGAHHSLARDGASRPSVRPEPGVHGHAPTPAGPLLHLAGPGAP